MSMPHHPYMVRAQAPGGAVFQTRSRAASAIVLAQKWAGYGYGHIEIIDQSGQACEPEQFRKRHMRPEMRRVLRGALVVMVVWYVIPTIRAESLCPAVTQPRTPLYGHAIRGESSSCVRCRL
jgi:hypothetical protein